MKQRLVGYTDNVRMFLMSSLRTVPFLKYAPDDALFHMALCMRQRQYHKDEMVLEEGVIAEHLLIVQTGILEMYTELDKRSR